MNMKKSIAAVSAGAMAISAMATVASANVIYHPTNENAAAAREQIVLTYDLSEYVEAFKPTSVKITTTYEGAEYLIKGLTIDRINMVDDDSFNKQTRKGSPTGYTVILGDILKDIQDKHKTYFLQTVELSAWSMDHKNPSMWNDGINGIRNRSKIWYSRASLGRDISDMQNEAAAVEDHADIKVLMPDTKENLSEYAFQVRFEELANSTSGDFILDEFKASDKFNETAGSKISNNPSYTVAKAITVKDTIATAPSAVTNGTVTSLENFNVPYIPTKAEAEKYSVVAVADELNEKTNATEIITIKWGAAALEATTTTLTTPQQDAKVVAALSNYFVKHDGTPLQVADFTANKVWYWNGVAFSDSIADAKIYETKNTDTIKAVDGKVGADLNKNSKADATDSIAAAFTGFHAQSDAAKGTDDSFNDVSKINNMLGASGTLKAAVDSLAPAGANALGTAVAGNATAAAPASEYVFTESLPASVKSYKYYVVQTPTAGFGSDIDTTYDPDAKDVSVVDGVHFGPYKDDLGKYVVVLKKDAIDKYTHWKGDNSNVKWKYSFNKFIVTSTFTVNYDDWDKADFYTGQGANAKFIPLHNGIGRGTTEVVNDKTVVKYTPDGVPIVTYNSSNKTNTYTLNEEEFFGTSSVNFNFPGAYQIIKPMRSTLTSPADVIKALEARKDGGKKYTSPVTVLNDVVGNNEEVSFEFVSCSKYVRNTDYVEAVRGRKVKNLDGTDYLLDGQTLWVVTMVNPTTGEQETRFFRGDKFNKAPSGNYFGEGDSMRVKYDSVVDSKFNQKFLGSVDTKNGGHLDEDWYNPVFGQHLYTNATYGTDNNHSLSTNGTGYALTGPTTDGADQTGNAAYNNAWGANAIGNYGSYNYGGWNTNLFNGGLVINSNWTMQINDSKHFDWGNNSIIFFWSDLTAEVKTHATNFLVAMQLYTPADWYWDTLNVGVGAAAAENVFNGASGEGLENDGEEVVEDDEVEELPEDEEEYFEDFEEEEEPEEEYYEEDDFDDFDDFEEEEEEEPEEVEVEVKEVPSPKTGNSPIALAVIPVALAAAAIVAKKKND